MSIFCLFVCLCFFFDIVGNSLPSGGYYDVGEKIVKKKVTVWDCHRFFLKNKKFAVTPSRKISVLLVENLHVKSKVSNEKKKHIWVAKNVAIFAKGALENCLRVDDKKKNCKGFSKTNFET